MVVYIALSEDHESRDLNIRANELLRETMLLQITRSAMILIDLFGFEKAFKRIKPKREDKQVEMYFPSLDGSITFALVSKIENFKPTYGKADNPVTKIVVNVKAEKVLKTISAILTLKDNLFGLMKIFPKLITRKLKIKGSLISAIIFVRCIMVGKHEMYKGQL